MAKFKNNTKHDVYIDLGRLVRVQAGEVIDLHGAVAIHPLTRLMEDVPPVPKPAPKKKPPKKSKSFSTSSTI